MVALTEAGADPAAISARLPEDRADDGISEAKDPYVNAELVGELAAKADQRTYEARRVREVGEKQVAFEQWADAEYGLDASKERLADLRDNDQREFLDALVDRFEQATGLDTASIDTSGVEPEFLPHVAGDDEQ